MLVNYAMLKDIAEYTLDDTRPIHTCMTQYEAFMYYTHINDAMSSFYKELRNCYAWMDEDKEIQCS